MMPTVKSKILAVGTPEPNVSAGWSIRVYDYKNMGSLVAVAHEFTSFSFTMELNGPGTGTITFDEDSDFWTAILNNDKSNRTLLNNEYVFEAVDGETPRFAWLGTSVTNTIVGEDEARAISISGSGIASVLKWAKVGRPGWPTKVPITGYTTSQADKTKKIAVYRATSSSDALPAYGWEFTPNWPTMRMWYVVFKAAQRRGLLPMVKPQFSALKGSDGKAWIWIKTVENVVATTDAQGKKHRYGYQPQDRNQNLLDFLGDCTGQDYSKWFGQRLEWIMYPGFKLDVRTRIGTDRHKSVRFFQGNIISDERTRDREEIANRVIALDEIGNESVRTDNKSVAKWNLRERWDESNKQIIVGKVRNMLADRYIQQTKDEKDQWSIRIPYGDPGRIPFRNFAVGDHIGMNVDYFGSTPTAVSEPVSYRVMAITISLSAEQTVPDCEITLKSLLDTKMESLQKQITQIMNNPVNANIDQKVADAVDNSTSSSNSSSGGGVGGGDGGIETGPGPNVFIGQTDPSTISTNKVVKGDFWLETYEN
jgi:hypothetical protein